METVSTIHLLFKYRYVGITLQWFEMPRWPHHTFTKTCNKLNLFITFFSYFIVEYRKFKFLNSLSCISRYVGRYLYIYNLYISEPLYEKNSGAQAPKSGTDFYFKGVKEAIV